MRLTMDEMLAPQEGKTISYEPWDKDDRGISIEPGQRCRVTMRQQEYPTISFLADRALAQSIVDFLDKMKDEA